MYKVLDKIIDRMLGNVPTWVYKTTITPRVKYQRKKDVRYSIELSWLGKRYIDVLEILIKIRWILK
jgi:hypothetical protein